LRRLPAWARCLRPARPVGHTLKLTLQGADFARPEGRGPFNFKGSGPFLHNDPIDRPAEVFGGVNSIATGGERASYLLLPVIPA
jgi:hypothetical protein